MIILVVLPGQSDPIDSVSLEPLFEKVQKDSSQELPQVETTSGKDGVDLVADFSLEIVAVHAVNMLGVTDDRFDATAPLETFQSACNLAIWANSFALLDQGSWIERKLILGVFEAAEVLSVEYVSEIR